MTAQAEDRQTAVYVYGILPGDVEVEPGASGVGDPPGEIRVVRHRDLAALVSDIDPDLPLGRPEDLVAHEELLDASAADVPVLPLRFGAVVINDDAVTGELLGPHHDEFAAALRQLEGHAEYVVKGRYAEDALLREVLSEDPRAARLGDQIRGADPDATRELRIQLGEIISNAVEVKRQQDTRTLGEALDGIAAASVVRPPTHELDAVHTALLVESSAAQDLEQAVQRLADEWDGRVELRLIGPMAAYDFMGTAGPAAAS
jgi:gas vesicle protein GvpL/GvpF